MAYTVSVMASDVQISTSALQTWVHHVIPPYSLTSDWKIWCYRAEQKQLHEF